MPSAGVIVHTRMFGSGARGFHFLGAFQRPVGTIMAMPAIASDSARKPRPRRILSLDAGGIGAVFTLEVLARIEALFRGHLDRHKLVLADEFDLIAGTGTGAVIATLLSLGLPVSEIGRLHAEESSRMALKPSWSRHWKARHVALHVTAFLQRFLSEDRAGGKPALLGSKRLRTLLLLNLRNATTGSAWQVSNNTKLPNDNLGIPLWQLVRASAAAPECFPPERIGRGRGEVIFADGGMTPYNNPAFIAFLMATLPGYRIGWETGVDKLQVVSVGAGSLGTRLTKPQAVDIDPIETTLHVMPALLQSASVEQDLICRVLGHCRWGDPIDLEIGALTKDEGRLLPLAERKFGYFRYDHRFTPLEEKRIRATRAADPLALDNVKLIPVLRELGHDYAQHSIVPWHLGLPATPHH